MTRKLAAYRARRDFTVSAEPTGLEDRDIRLAEHPRFVVQKHDATRLHYDLRLEIDGAFHSWAITKGPSLDPAEKRLAVEVEDHPLAYGDFEGTIPKGEYGGGTVMIWDRGFWAPEGDEPIAQALKRGELKFALAGEKLKGSFVLVRLKRRERETKDNWLLIKHRDRWATPGKDDIQAKDRSVASGRSMHMIANGKGKAAEPFMTEGPALGAKARWSAAETARAARRPAKIAPPRLTSPDRVLWPDIGAMKQDLATYLAAVAPIMIDHLYGRPCSLLRAPEGIGAETFFQRHMMPGMPDAITPVTVKGDKKPYVQIDDAQSLVDLAQLSAIEFHPWNCAPFAPAVPGRLVFDLDPAPDVGFDRVVAAARELRERLAAVGLASFCKTTGGKGLHVVVPLEPDERIGWPQAKLFAQTVSAQMADDSPQNYLTKMSKAARTGRIFIDYLRNDEKSTAVAPFSPRARPGATVSMPLAWSQVRKGLDPKRFTITTVPRLIARAAPWRDYDDARRPLRDAIAALLEA